MNKLIAILFIFISVSCSCQNFFGTHTGGSSADSCYGVIYNWYVTQEDIAPDGWHVPDSTEWATLFNDIDTYNETEGYWPLAGKLLKESGTAHWSSPNTATNNYGFSALGAGSRDDVGGYDGLLEQFIIWASDEYSETEGIYLYMEISDYVYPPIQQQKILGNSIRLIKDNSTDTGTMTDYDGNVYHTVKIGDQVWMAENLKVTHYNDGTPIPNVADSATWIGLTSGAMCAYNNDWNYACVEEP